MVAQGIPADSVQRALTEVFERPAYRWVQQRSVRSWLGERWAELGDSLASLEASNPALFKVLVAALIVLLVVLLVHIGYVVWRVLRGAPAPAVQALAGAVKGWDAGSHARHADELAAAGRWTEALGHRFLALVLELDHRRALRFHPSKTPAEYVGEARLDPPGRESMIDVVGRLYRHVFGAAPCDAAAYHAFGESARLVIQHARSH